MPRLEGVQLVEALVAASPSTAICVYTGDGDEELARACIDAGARAFVLKESSLDDLGRALDAVCASRTYLDPALVGNRKRTGSLTERELDVLRLLADGHAHEEIGRRLGIGAETVRTHVRKASDRLGAGTRTQAVATALRLGLIA
jgi:DNA-binding NarL/FixJ family response regulator